ncbi:hypothetical protein AB4144_14210, partial [Rhizobiaceae sp. 2RAB30]
MSSTMESTMTRRLAEVAPDDVFAVDPSIKARKRENLLVIALRAGLLVVILAAWDLASGKIVSPFWVSSPSQILFA